MRPWSDSRSRTRLAAVAVAAALVPTLASAEIELVQTEKNTVALYGFVKLDATYQSDGMNSLTAPRFATGGDGGTSFTAMHSRFGLRWTGPESAGGLKVGGLLEWDLFDASRNQMQFRDRLVALTLSKDESTWLFGQHWDVFSPLNPTTLMTNGNLWQTGNLGFRRAQVRYAYSGAVGELALSANDPTSDGATASDMPVFESRAGFKFAGKGRIGVSGAWGQDRRTTAAGEEDLDIAGVGVDWVVPLGGDFQWKGEAAAGENLGIFLSRSGVAADPSSGTLQAQEVVAYWTELVYSAERGSLWIGYAAETLDDEGLPSDVFEVTATLFGGVEFRVAPGAFLAFELGRFESELAGGESVESSQGMFSAIYRF